MSNIEQFDQAFARCPLVAILRGVRPDEVEAIGDALVEAGFAILEVPLNSPDPLDSIARLAKRLAERAVVGAGTVLRIDDVAQVADAGGKLIIAPNTDPLVIDAAVRRGLVAIPGFMTPSEAIVALDAGAAALKLFPAEAVGPRLLSATRTILPSATRILPVGGITPGDVDRWRAAGANGFGLGSALYRPGVTAGQVSENARAFMAAWKAVSATA